jgi:hypothetical protein
MHPVHTFQPISTRYILILLSHLQLGLASGPFTLSFPTTSTVSVMWNTPYKDAAVCFVRCKRVTWGPRTLLRYSHADSWCVTWNLIPFLVTGARYSYSLSLPVQPSTSLSRPSTLLFPTCPCVIKLTSTQLQMSATLFKKCSFLQYKMRSISQFLHC